jgi:hypothetical protein
VEMEGLDGLDGRVQSSGDGDEIVCRFENGVCGNRIVVEYGGMGKGKKSTRRERKKEE